MKPPLDQPGHTISATDMARSFGAKLAEVTSGNRSHWVIVEGSEPAALLVGADAYLALQEEIEDLRAELLAVERLSTLNASNTTSLEEMKAAFT